MGEKNRPHRHERRGLFRYAFCWQGYVGPLPVPGRCKGPRVVSTLPLQCRHTGFWEPGVPEDPRGRCRTGGERTGLHPSRVRDDLGAVARGAGPGHGGVRRGRRRFRLSFLRFPPSSPSSPPSAPAPSPGALSLSPVPARTGSGRRLAPPLLVDQPLAAERLLGREVGVVRLVVRAGSEEGEGRRAAALQAVHHAAAPRDRRGETPPRGGGRLPRARVPAPPPPVRHSSHPPLPPPAARAGPAGVRGVRGKRPVHGPRRVRRVRRVRGRGTPRRGTRGRIGYLVGCLVVRLAPLPPLARVTGPSVAGRVPGAPDVRPAPGTVVAVAGPGAPCGLARPGPRGR